MNKVNFKLLTLIPATRNYNKPVMIIWRNTHKHLAIFPNTLLSNTLHRLKSSAFTKLNTLLNKRDFSSDSSDNRNRYIPNALMKFEPVIKPELMLTLKNWILTKLIIQPYLDREFTIKDFNNGAKQALAIVSALLSQGEFRTLKGLVTDEAIKEIESNFPALNLKERQDLFVRTTDVLFSFPYQIGIIFDDINQKRFAEITVVYHALNDFDELKATGELITNRNRGNVKICNYRFIREYTKGVESDWIINRLGHFKLCQFE